MAENPADNPPSTVPTGSTSRRRFPSDQSHLRVSDAERDLIANELGEALTVGRLSSEEHAERLDAVFAAKTQGELEPLVADLPAPGRGALPRSGASGGLPTFRKTPSTGLQSAGSRPYGAERFVTGHATSLQAHTTLSSTERKGTWVVPARYLVSSVMGSVTIDLREALFLAPMTTIKADTYWGSVEIIVPEDVIVRVDGTGIMGTYELQGDPPTHTDPSFPVVTITGYAVMGSIWAEYRAR